MSGSGSTPSEPGRTGDRAPHSASRPRHWLIAAVTFVVGLFAGGVIVGLVSGGSTPSPRVTVTRGAPGGSPAGSSTAGGAHAQADVNAACLRAVRAAQGAYGNLGDLVSALRSLDPGRIDKVIQRLEPLQTQLKADLHTCRISTRLPDGSITTTTPTSVAPSPSGS